MPETDYAALAEKARQTAPIDYAALAEQARKSAPVSQGTTGGLILAGASKVIPAAGRALYEFGTSPTAPKVGATIGRAIGTVVPLAASAIKAASGDLAGAAYAAASTAASSWGGGKVGWFTAKRAQDIARPIATIVEKAAPYMQALTTIGGIQSALDLAQMADPNRKDIGFLGIGKSEPDPDHPALLNLALSKARDAIQSLISHHDMTPEQAAQTLIDSRKKAK